MEESQKIINRTPGELGINTTCEKQWSQQLKEISAFS